MLSGEKVRLNMPDDELISTLVKEWDCTRAEAIGLRAILKTEANELISIRPLTDENGVEKMYAIIMTNDGMMYLFEAKYVEKF